MQDFIIIGGGQAGLSIGYYLQQASYNFTILDGANEVGEAWLKRWDSLKLFTPSEFNNLPGMEFPCAKGHYPNKYEVASYLKSYVANFDLPVTLNCRVSSVKKQEGYFSVYSSTGLHFATQVIVATGPFHIPFIPKCHQNIGKQVLQLHSKAYKNTEQLQDGPTLVVGAGDSGMQILKEVASTGRKTYFSGNIPSSVMPQEFLGKTLWWWFSKTGFLSIHRNSWLGRFMQKNMQPVIGIDVKGLLKQENIHPVGFTLEADKKAVKFEAGWAEDIKNIVWATGYRPDFGWIDGLTLDKNGYPINTRGISDLEGLFFIGLPWMHTRGSATLGGVKEDARYLFDYIQSNTNKEEGVFA